MQACRNQGARLGRGKTSVSAVEHRKTIPQSEGSWLGREESKSADFPELLEQGLAWGGLTRSLLEAELSLGLENVLGPGTWGVFADAPRSR